VCQIQELSEAETVSYQEQCGLENGSPCQGPPPNDAPRWKMAIVTWLGVNVAVIAWRLLLTPLIGEWHLVPRSLLTNALVVALLTWVIMPLLSRLFRPSVCVQPDFSAVAAPLKKGP